MIPSLIHFHTYTRCSGPAVESRGAPGGSEWTQLLTWLFQNRPKSTNFRPPKTRLQPTFVALGPLGDTAQGVETKLGPNWSRKGDFPLSARYLIEDSGPGSPPILGNYFLDSSPYLVT